MILKSKSLILKPLSQEDYKLLRIVRPCDEYYLMVGTDPVESIFLSDEKFNESFSSLMDNETFWNVFKGSEIIGVAFLHSINTIDKQARYAVGIYNKEKWGHGYGQQITQTVLQYAFETLELHKVDLKVLAYNKRAIASYLKSGFIQEGTLRENAYINDAWHDDIIMSILKHEFYSNN